MPDIYIFFKRSSEKVLIENVSLLYRVDVFTETFSYFLITGGIQCSYEQRSLLAGICRQTDSSPKGPESLSMIWSF